MVISEYNFVDIKNVYDYVCMHYPDIKTLSFHYARFDFDAKYNFPFPKLSVVANELNSIIKQKNVHFPLQLNIEAIPYCLLNNQLWKFHADFTRDISEFKTQERKVKSNEMCRTCSMNNKCFGVWPKYAKVHGFSELQPIKE